MEESAPVGFHRTYGVELLFAASPRLDKRAILERIRKRCPAAQALDGKGNSDLLAFIHPDHLVEYSDGRAPAQVFMAGTDKKVAASDFESALQQSWSFPEARDVIERCTHSVLVSDLMASNLPYRQRIDLFQRALLGIVETTSPLAIHWQPTQRIVAPFSLLRAATGEPSALFFAGALNVRFFNVQQSDGEMLMDTLGLAALGLPDLQCHFRQLDPNTVGSVLYSIGWYIFENDDVIEDGHTVEGDRAGSKWRCQHEVALAPPEREVLDIDPGAPYAAGNRGAK